MPAAVGGVPQSTRAAEAVSSAQEPAKLKQAASQFEALLIGQMLKQFRETDQGEGGESSESIMEIAESQFAQALAARGGLGLANMVVKSMTHD